jgi:alkanesulfonate monooxygenase SsuD/methylene tetrahydromethanopterin reductase-like flavin-dependent oxidoreductase (luciferase family)
MTLVQDQVTDESLTVGVVLREEDLRAWQGRLSELTDAVVGAGLDHVTIGDHVSFADGHGIDGLIQATALLAAHPALQVQTGIYLLALRHPATVARCPCGRPEDVAAALEPYLAAGCRRFNFVPEAPDLEHAIAAIAEVKGLLAR